jgi:probable rRNA maturation factor
MAVSLNNEQGHPVPDGVLADMERIAAEVLVLHEVPADAEVSLTLCTDEMIQTINKQWRTIDAPTDVLSFPLLDGDGPVTEGELLLGDIIISVERAIVQAEDFGHSLTRELLYLFTHGMLHLLGYDHHDETERCTMREKEEALLSSVGAERK